MCEPRRRGKNLHKYLQRKTESAARGENAAQKRLSEAEADKEMRRWEETSSEMVLHETHRELDSQRLRLIRVKGCGELEMRNRLYQESHI